MKNFELSLPLVDGSMLDVYYGEVSGKEIIHSLVGDDFGPPPVYMAIRITTKSGKNVNLHIPYDHKSDAVVLVDDEQL